MNPTVFEPDEILDPIVTRRTTVSATIEPGQSRHMTLTEVFRKAGVTIPSGLEAALSVVTLPDGAMSVNITLEEYDG